MTGAALLFLLAALTPGPLTVPDLDGVARQPLVVPQGRLSVLFFVTHDCPIANGSAPEIARICAEYGPRGLDCTLVYVDPTASPAVLRRHAASYGHGPYPRILDRRHALVRAAGATATPEAALFGPNGKLLYRGRIDDSVSRLGQSRRPVQQAYLRMAIEAALAGQPIRTPQTRPVGCYIPDLAVLNSYQ